MSPTFLVNEIYPCLQGEGIGLGIPSVLVRFQICNLRCSWCDTAYTHTMFSDPKDTSQPLGPQRHQRLSSQYIVEQIQSWPQFTHVIFSGGEPTLQNFPSIAHQLPAHYSFEVETNGTRIPHQHLQNFCAQDYARFQWNVSPKFSNAGETLCHDSLLFWSEQSKIQNNVYFKFVIRQTHQKEDLEQTWEILKTFSLDRQKVWLMAEGTKKEDQIHSHWLHDICLNLGVRYSPRLHVLLFGPRRGV